MRNEMDRLSELPDDTLVSIISRLSFEEATATSILSTRWRHVHTNVLSLDFHFAFKPYTGHYNCPKLKKAREERKSVFADYISRINHAIDSYKGRVMHASNVFRVHTPCLGDNFYKWLEFALSRKVEIIDLDITTLDFHDFDCCYNNFVPNLITRSNKQSLLGVKELSLSSIYFKEENMELILSNFVFLEHLSIDSLQTSGTLRVVGHCKLTHLNVSNMSCIKSIEIRDMINLVSLQFSMLDTFKLLLDRVPNLVHFSNDDGRYKMLDKIFPKISCIYHQLLHLKLSIFLDDIERDGLTFTKLTKLKHVELKVLMACCDGTRRLFPLIESCPSLEKLEIEFSWSMASADFKDIYRMVDHPVERKMLNNNLKKVRLSEYFGSDSELEFLIYVVKNVVALQELVIEVWDITPEIRQEALSFASNHLQFVQLNSSINVSII